MVGDTRLLRPRKQSIADGARRSEKGQEERRLAQWAAVKAQSLVISVAEQKLDRPELFSASASDSFRVSKVKTAEKPYTRLGPIASN